MAIEGVPNQPMGMARSGQGEADGCPIDAPGASTGARTDCADRGLSTAVRKRAGAGPEACWPGYAMDAPQCCPIDPPVDSEMSDGGETVGTFPAQDFIERLRDDVGLPEKEPGISSNAGGLLSQMQVPLPEPPPPPAAARVCTAGGKRAQESDFRHCPTAQSFVRCGPHHRAELCVLDNEDIRQLHDMWWRYNDDLTWPWYEKKPQFSDRDFNTFRDIAQKVVDAMVEEYRQPMVLDQATISNTSHIGHPPHADNVQFDSVWWNGKRIRSEDEVVAAQEGAYILWRPEKTSYRSYSCTVSLSDPNGYEGGEVQFFSKWGDKDPTVSYKCAEGFGVAFCGCQRNIHAVTGVKSGFRLVFLVWTRPPEVRVPEGHQHVCYFRPGTGLGVWLTTADIQNHQRKRGRADPSRLGPWVPKDEDDGTCECVTCREERQKLAWSDCIKVAHDDRAPFTPPAEPTPTTSAGNTPRTNATSSSSDNEDVRAAPRKPQRHCPRAQGIVCCESHGHVELDQVLTKSDAGQLQRIWQAHRDDLTWPWYDQKPVYTDHEFTEFRRIAQKVVDAMAEIFKQPLVLDQATVSNTNHIGHPPHADNVQFDSVWWKGQQIKQKDELAAARGGAEILWRDAKTNYRNYGATVALSDPSQYGGGDLEFYSQWGERDPAHKYRCRKGDGLAFCGCQKSIHAVTGVKWGFRLVLLIWTRPPEAVVPEDQLHVCYFRPGTGLGVWLTSADLLHYPARRQKRQSWVPIVNTDGEADGDSNNGESDQGVADATAAESSGWNAARSSDWDGWSDWNGGGHWGQPADDDMDTYDFRQDA